jgi:membrane protein DedA with SNARE-associated domain
MSAVVAEILGRFSYLGIFALIFSGSFGIPIPEELPIAVAGVLAQRGEVDTVLSLVVCIAGVLTGDLMLYVLGRRWGIRVLQWPLMRAWVTPEREAALAAAYRRYGLLVVAVARLVVGMRTAAFLTAGIARVPVLRFFLVDTAASLVSVPVTFGLGYLLADHVEALLGEIRRAQLWALLGIVGAGCLAAGLLILYRRTRGMGLGRRAPDR